MADDPDEFTVRTHTGQDTCPACQHFQAGDFDPSRHVHSCRRETPAERETRIAVARRVSDARRAYEDQQAQRWYGR